MSEMASIYQRKGSRFWWVKFRDPASGKIVQQSTSIDVALPGARRKALAVEAEKSRDEYNAPRVREQEFWDAWAGQYFEDRYSGKRGSLLNARNALVDLKEYFRETGIRAPRLVNYQNAKGYLAWRKSAKRTPLSTNSIRLQFVYFRLLMAEAVRRGFCPFNPCRDVEVPSAPAKQKKEITPEDEAKIVDALANKPEWMRDQWLVLMRQGCRIAETNIPLHRINIDQMTVELKLKGGRMHAAQLHPALLPLVESARAAGRDTLLPVANATSWSAIWNEFFQRVFGEKRYSIHCTRVTVITRLVRAGHSVPTICNFIGHGEEVNRVYRKLRPADSSALLTTLGGDASPPSGSPKL